MANRKIVFGGAGTALGAAVAIILAGVYHDEGGYVNRKDDPGGETMRGVTKGVAREEGYKGAMIAFPKQCDDQTPVCSDKVYFERFMQRPGYLPIIAASPAVGEELVNSAVNFGPARPSAWLQQSVNALCPAARLKVDARVGAGTQQAFASCRQSLGKVSFCLRMLDQMDGRQKAEYDRLVRVNPRLNVFYRGWVNKRIGNVDRAKCQAER
ncbi:glycosyl hydrolase 108 family protein [Sphingobium sp. AP49]|uniref:glycosyl hydrolase 108 family protein n=1 Tax=Sphingobium sp. AP49 TaxID=1144307 RepID=UPI00026ED978|nr:glycosyl hydrolase 108 family protein [Sphingobium sp. AP49]WHO37891.1 glycosyl hydrolase 108 family protein [Sphingobium sp. AP49]